MSEPVIHIDIYGDPACPWDFAAEGARLRLRWRFGDALSWRHVMVGLSSTADEYAERGIEVSQIVRGRQSIRDRFGVPIDTTPATRFAVTIVACRAVVGVRRNAPRALDAFLRALRVVALSTPLEVDSPEAIAQAARTAGLDPADVAGWSDEVDTATELAEDMAEARRPATAALAQRERLATTLDGTWRYTCPSYRLTRGATSLEAPGFQPARAYEVLVANLAPELVPRAEPRSVEEILDWAPYPLATAEIAVIMEADPDATRARLEASGGHRSPVANDAYWSREISGGSPQPIGSPSTAAA
jgi:predicted DsbA family dithiol-disulfide isomerase